MAVNLRGSPPWSTSCEGCGRRGTKYDVLAWVDPRHLGACSSCGRVVCWSCRREDGCRVCLAAPGEARPRSRGRRVGTGVVAVAWILALGVVVLVGLTRLDLLGARPPPAGPSGAVLGEQATPSAIGSSQAGGSAPGLSPVSGSTPAASSPATSPVPTPVAPARTPRPEVRVVSWTLPAWTSAVRARHGEALFVVENRGSAPVEVVAAESRYEVVAAGGVVASGVLDAVIPPVIQPGATAYAFAAFALPGGLPRGSAATVEFEVRTPRRARIVLDVRGVDVTTASTIAVEGTARNPARAAAVEGVVGAIVFGRNGRPLFAVVDAASVSALGARARGPFRAAYPAIPADGQRFGRVVVHGWALRAGAGAASP